MPPRSVLSAATFSLTLLVVAAALWLVGTVVFAVPLLLYSLVAAVLLAALLEPLVSRLEGSRSPRWLAAVVTELVVLSGVAIVVFVLFFLLKDGPSMWSWALRWRDPERRRRTDQVGREVWTTLSSYTRGVVAVALIDAVAIGTALYFLGVPLWLSLTMLTFLGAFVPFIGATVSGALAVAVTAVTVGPGQALILVVVVLLVQQLEGNVLHPLIVGRAVQLHPVVVLAAVTAGGLLAGIGGAVLAVPLAAVAYQVADLTVGPGSRGSATDGAADGEGGERDHEAEDESSP